MHDPAQARQISGGLSGSVSSWDSRRMSLAGWLRNTLRLGVMALLIASGNTIRADDQYSFSTFAGTAGGPGSRDGVGVAARFSGPRNIAIDSAGNLFVADAYMIRKITPDAVVTTIAGSSGQNGSDDGVGSAARFRNPSDVAVDGNGNLYVADQENHTIRKITPQGVVTTLAGRAEDIDGDGYNDGGYEDGVGAEALFHYPVGVAVDSGGNVYVADSWNHVVRKVTPEGVVTTLAGTPGERGTRNGRADVARFGEPHQIRIAPDGSILVGDNSPNAIRRISPDGMVSTVANSTAIFGASNFGLPWGLAVDSTGTIYVAENQVGPSIRKISPGGTVTTLAGPAWDLNTYGSGNVDGQGTAARFGSVWGLAVDKDGVLFAADRFNHTIRRITPGGLVTTFAGSAPGGSADGPPGIARFNEHGGGIAFHSSGDLFVTDGHNHTVRKVTAKGMASTFAGTAGREGSASATGSAARFNTPVDVAVDRAGNLYVSDLLNHTIRKISPAAEVTTFVGAARQAGAQDGTGSQARFNQPWGLGFDRGGNLFVADRVNSTIRRITPDGVVSTFAGMPGSRGSADGIGSEAQFNLPTGLVVDSQGNVFVSDHEDTAIRKITPEGAVTTFAGSPGENGAADGRGAQARFSGARYLAVDAADNLYVADGYNSTIRKITPAGDVTTIGGSPGLEGDEEGVGSRARFRRPRGIALDPSGHLYVLDSGRIVLGVPGGLADPPRLTIAPSPSGISISWSAGSSGFIFERSGSLSQSGWSVGPIPPVVDGDRAVILMPANQAQQFFRLRKP